MKDLAAVERLGRKFTSAPFIPHGRGLREINFLALVFSVKTGVFVVMGNDLACEKYFKWNK